MFLELFLSVLAAVLLLDFFIKRRRNNVLNQSGFKAPAALPVIGCAHHMLNATPESIFGIFSSWCKQYGKTYYIWMLHDPILITADVKLIEPVLTSQQVITKNNEYDLLKSWIGEGLLLSTGKKWHQHRKIITPTFHFKILEQFVEVFDRQSAKLMEKFKEQADGKTIVDVYPKICLMALDIIAETAMGVKVNAQDDPNLSYTKAVTETADMLLVRSMKIEQRYDILMKVTAPAQFKKLNDNIKVMHDFANKVICERRAALEKSIADGTYRINDDEYDLGTKKRMALLDVLLQSNIDGKPLSNDDIREEVDTFMFAGHDTTTTASSHILYLLARHPEVQEKLFEEIRGIFGDDKNRKIEMNDLHELKYLECVIKEGLRVYPPASTIGRYVAEDVELGGNLIPADTNITVLIYEVMRDPDNFPDPDDFKPERFDITTGTKINPFAYIPFSAGPRNCIGQKFAMLEMKTIISQFLRHFELLPLGEAVRPYMSIVSRSANGCQVGLKTRVY